MQRQCNTKKVQYDMSATQEKCSLEMLAKHGKSSTRKKFNMKIVQHEQRIMTQYKIERVEREDGTTMRKRITGCLSMDHYALVETQVMIKRCFENSLF